MCGSDCDMRIRHLLTRYSWNNLTAGGSSSRSSPFIIPTGSTVSTDVTDVTDVTAVVCALLLEQYTAHCLPLIALRTVLPELSQWSASPGVRLALEDSQP